MPIMIEEMQAEVLPERTEPEETTSPREEGAAHDTQLLDRIQREQQIREQRRLRWRAD